MIFETEEARTAYHELPAQEQLDYCRKEVELAREGKELLVSLSVTSGGVSEVIIRITDKFNFPTGVL